VPTAMANMILASMTIEQDQREAASEVESSLGWPSSYGLGLVLLYVALFLIRPWEELLPVLQSWRFERVYAAVMIGVVLLTGRGWRWSTQSVSVAVFTAMVSLSAMRAWQTEYAWPQLYQYVTVVITYYLMLAVCRGWHDLMWLIVSYVATMHVYLSKSLWEYFVNNRHLYAQGVNRLLGIEVTYGEPNAVAMSAVLSLPAWWFLWRSRHELFGTWSSGLRRVVQWGLLTYPPIAVLSVGLTNSRAGMVGLAACFVGAMFYISGSGRGWTRGAIAIGLLLLIFVLAPTEQRDRLRTLWNPAAGPANARESASGRWQGFLAAMEMLRARPLTGIGLGNFVPYRVAYIDGVALVAHNLPGQILGETGWLGAAAFAWLVAVSWWNTSQLRRVARDDFEWRAYDRLAVAIRLTILLSLLFGLSLHNGLRYNWLWMAAFAQLACEFWQRAAAGRAHDEGELLV